MSEEDMSIVSSIVSISRTMGSVDGIERHAFVPCASAGAKPPLAIHTQRDPESGQSYAVFSLDFTVALNRMRSRNPGEAAEKALADLEGRLCEGSIPLEMYSIRVIPRQDEYVPYLGVNPKEVAKRAVRFRYTVWEAGGMNPVNHKGAAQIVTNVAGVPLVPAAVRKRGRLANARHAVFSLYPETNICLVQAFVYANDQMIRIGRVKWEDAHELPEVVTVWEGQDHTKAPEVFFDAVCVALDKASTVNCRDAMFIRKH